MCILYCVLAFSATRLPGSTAAQKRFSIENLEAALRIRTLIYFEVNILRLK